MKKWLLLFLLALCLIFAGCGKKDNVEKPDIENVSIGSLDAIHWKSSLTLSDLDVIEHEVFPQSYSYDVYNEWELSDSWAYVYSDEDIKLFSFLYDVVSRDLVSSESEDWKIYTLVDFDLQDGSERSVEYINDADTMMYLAAVVNDWNNTILYTFDY